MSAGIERNSHRLRVHFQSSGGWSRFHRPVAKLIGTLKITVEMSAAPPAEAVAIAMPRVAGMRGNARRSTS
jgi:hypothetical protein